MHCASQGSRPLTQHIPNCDITLYGLTNGNREDEISVLRLFSGWLISHSLCREGSKEVQYKYCTMTSLPPWKFFWKKNNNSETAHVKSSKMKITMYTAAFQRRRSLQKRHAALTYVSNCPGQPREARSSQCSL